MEWFEVNVLAEDDDSVISLVGVYMIDLLTNKQTLG
jgi:hypothetical protein